MADLITELRERRVLPAVGVYAAGCWVLIEILDRLVERYLLSPYLTDIVFWGLYSLIPAVVLVAWSYGRPGKDTATTAQKVGVPINIIATAGLLITVFGGKDLGITAERITLANEEGVEETHIVPKASFRSRLGVFFYDNRSGDPALDWLQYAVTELLTQDLQQDPYIMATSPWVGGGNGYYARMKAAGFEDGLDVPRSLLREIARDANRQYFIEGSVDRSDDDYIVNTRVWETDTMRQVADIEERGWDYYEVLDRTSRAVREAVNVPSVDAPGQEDLPLADTYGESEAALKLYIQGLNTRLFTNDVAAANALMDQALAEDPNFVLAHFLKAFNLAEAGDLPSAAASLQEAQRLEYRLPMHDRATLKAMYYRTSGQTQKLMEFLRMQARLRGDAQTHGQLGMILMVAGQPEEAKQALTRALELDSLAIGHYLTLSALERSLGNMEAAIENARIYQRERPEDMGASLTLGDLLRDTGDLEQADDHYRQAQIIESGSVAPILRRVIIASRRGDIAEARELLEEAQSVAITAIDHAAVHQSASYLEARLGRIRLAIEQLLASEPYIAESQPPFLVALSVHSALVGMHLMVGDAPAAEAVLAKSRPLLQPPLDQFMAAAECSLYSFQREFEAAEDAVGRFRGVMQQLSFDGLLFQADMIESELEARRENWAEAARLLASALDQIEHSFIAAEMHATSVPTLLGQLAWYQIRAGDLEAAERTLETGFRLDPSLPSLWSARALLQQQSDREQLAGASIHYALTLWEDADPDYEVYQKAISLSEQIGATVTGL